MKIKNNIRWFGFLMMMILIGSLSASASVPKRVTYHGMLKDSSGSFLTGTYDMNFRIYNVATSGTALWTETQVDVSVSSGRFTVELGSETALNLDFSQGYWLSVEIESDGEMTPRQKLTSVGYAYMAEQVVNAFTQEDHDALSHKSIAGVKSNSSNIAKTNFKLDAYTQASANSMGDMIVDVFNDDSGIDAANSSGYQWRDDPNYDVKVQSSESDATGSGTPSASSEWNTSNYAVSKAVDNSASTNWLSSAVPSSSVPQWWQYDFGSGNAKTIVKFTLQHGADGNPAYYMPKDFTFQGSNDASSWTTLDSPASQTNWSSQEKRTFAFANSTAYRYYRIHIIAKESGGEGVVIGEVELMEVTSATASVVSTGFTEPVVPKEAMVIVDETLNTGTITYHVSRDDGTTWTQVDKDTVVDITSQPTGTELRWKADITGDAELNSIAVAV